jgi:DNA-directed RNA polymerase subunit N (RpoN/RPB10)
LVHYAQSGVAQLGFTWPLPKAVRWMKEWTPLISQRSSVEVLNRNAFQVNSFEAANIDCGHPVAFWIGTFSVRVNATRLAKAVLDDLLVERVRADVLFRCEHVELFARHKPQE